jgi:hypothetical protein
VARTEFLLDYISDIGLRRTIQAATNKREAFNLFVQWVAFGGGRLLAENTRDEQRKMIKYHHLAANLLIFHNVATMTKALQLPIAEGHWIDEEALICLSLPNRAHQPLRTICAEAGSSAGIAGPGQGLRMPPRSEGLPMEKIKKSVTI